MITDSDVERVLPADGFVRRYVEYGSFMTDAPKAYHLGIAHALLGTITPPNMGLSFGGYVYGNQWVMLVGESGSSRKTAAIGLGKRILRRINPELLMSDIQSVKSLAESLADQPSSLLSYGEFGTFLKGTKSGSFKEEIRAKMMELWDCDGFSYKTGKKHIRIDEPRLSMLAGSAPHFLISQTTEEDWTAGFLNRWMMLVSAREDIKHIPPAEGWPEMEDYLVNYLAFLSARSIGRCRGWHDSGSDYWIDWSERAEQHFKERLTVPGRQGFLARAKTVALKCALTYGLDFGEAAHANGGDWKLGLDVLVPATQMAELHLHSALHAVERFGLSRNAREQRAVLQAVGEDGKQRTIAAILRRCRPVMDLRDVKRVLDTLRAAGHVHYYREASVDGAEFWSSEAILRGTDMGEVLPFEYG